jgi:hypothetical protein
MLWSSSPTAVKWPARPTSSFSSSYCVALVSWYSSTSTWASACPSATCSVLQQAQRQADQVVEVHALVGRQALLVARHQQRVWRSPSRGLGQRAGGVQACVLPAADGPLPLARGGGVGRRAAVLEQAQHVVAVQDAELGLEAQRRAVLAQHAHAQRVEGADQHLAGGLAHQAAARSRISAAALLVKVMAAMRAAPRRSGSGARSCA